MAESLPVAHPVGVADPKGAANTGGKKDLHSLATANTVAVVQETQSLESFCQRVCGVPYEEENVYRMSTLTHYVVPDSPTSPGMWDPRHEELKVLEPALVSKEQSSCCVRALLNFFNCGHLRPLRLTYAPTAAGPGSEDASYYVERDFRLGGCCCCPLEMYLFGGEGANARPIGRVRERFDPYLKYCALALCTCTTYHDVEAATHGTNFERKYTLRANLCCFGRVNNCCRPSCCCPNAVYDVLDSNDNVVSHVQKAFGGQDSCCSAFWRCVCQFDNYIVSFPPAADTAERPADDKALLLTAVHQLDYQVFEKPGGDMLRRLTA